MNIVKCVYKKDSPVHTGLSAIAYIPQKSDDEIPDWLEAYAERELFRLCDSEKDKAKGIFGKIKIIQDLKTMFCIEYVVHFGDYLIKHNEGKYKGCISLATKVSFNRKLNIVD